MANVMYDKGREKFLRGEISWNNDDIRIILIDADDYTLNASTHEFLSSIPAVARISVSPSLSGKTTTAGVADANDVTLTGVTGDPSEALVIYKHTGSDATASLIAYLDSAGGLPYTPNSGDTLIQFDNGANRIFKL